VFRLHTVSHSLTPNNFVVVQLRTHSDLFEAEPVAGDDDEPETPDMDKWSAGGWLVIVTVITAFCADVLVGSIDETATKWNIPKP
jgi:Ca2+:H+ antiporter